MDINYFDIVASIIILLLGLKGILNGFFKELFGLVGIIGGLFVASRVGNNVGEYLNNAVFHFQNSSAIAFTGFLLTFAAFWLLMIFVGFSFKKLSSLSGLGPVDRILGFIFGAGKFFLIAAVIAFSVHNIQALKSTLNFSLKTSILFPILVETGGYIMKMDPTHLTKDINNSISQKSEDIQENIKKKITDATKEQIDEIKTELKEK